MSESTSGLVERADRRGGVTIEMGGLKPVNIVVGGCVYIKQGEEVFLLTREAAVSMAWTILASVERALTPLPSPTEETGSW